MKLNKSLLIVWTIFSCISLYAVYAGVYWLAIGLLLLFSFYLLSNILLSRFFKKWQQKAWFYGITYLFTAFFAAIILKVFVLEICLIPSGSMENTLKTGDHAIINKLAYGPRMPRSIVEVPWLHGLYLVFAGSEHYTEKLEMAAETPYQRWTGFSKINRKDIIVFNAPFKKGLLLIKRFVALPKDEIQVKKGEVYINQKKQAMPIEGKNKYQIYATNTLAAKKYLDSLEIYTRYSKEKGVWNCTLDQATYKRIQNSTVIDSINLFFNKKRKQEIAWHSVSTWQTNDFGPFIMPSKGFEIKLDSNNLKIYGKIIEDLEQADITGLETYTFQKNYYFAMGDNRPYSVDSRTWGLVPEDHIIGKASTILSKTRTFISKK